MSPPPPPQGPGRPRDADADRAILAATRELLREGGLEAVTVTAVARAAGVSRPTVYRRHPDPPALAAAVLLADLDEVAMAPAAEVAPELPIEGQLVAFVAPIFAYYAAHPENASALLQLAIFADTPSSEPLNAQLSAFLMLIGGRVAAAMGAGELRADLDVPTFVGAYFALYLATAIGGARGGFESGEEMTRRFEQMLGLLLGGCRP